MRKPISVAALAILTLFVPELFGQGCVMCRTNAMSQGPRAAAALNHGVLVLLVPSLLMLAGVCVMIFRRSGRESGSEEAVSLSIDD